jgi:transposase
MKVYAGIDLHSTNNFIGIVDENNERLFSKKLPNDFNKIIRVLETYKDEIKGVVIESTYNWYWLVDALQESGYPVQLANPCAIQRYSGIKHTDDEDDAFWLADMSRMGILPTGYIYPKGERSVRDLLRRRMMFVRHRATYKNSLTSMMTRYTGKKIVSSKLYNFTEEDLSKHLPDEVSVHMAQHIQKGIYNSDEIISKIEKEVVGRIKIKEEYRLLQTIPGVGMILTLTIMLEAGDIKRFPDVRNYSSYCRCVKSERTSNGKKKGENNRKNGNRYLGWAYLEAAHFAIQYSPEAKRFYERKKRTAHEFVALKAVSNKLAKASYYIMRDHVPYDVHKCFV